MGTEGVWAATIRSDQANVVGAACGISVVWVLGSGSISIAKVPGPSNCIEGSICEIGGELAAAGIEISNWGRAVDCNTLAESISAGTNILGNQAYLIGSGSNSMPLAKKNFFEF